MEWICFGELSGLERVGVLGAVAIGLVLFLIGVSLAFRIGFWKGSLTKVEIGDRNVTVPPPLACIATGILAIGVAGWWLWKKFPENNMSYGQKAWTLAEIKERVENESKVQIQLEGRAGGFAIDRELSGACASDLVTSICEAYPTQLKCDHPDAKRFIISARP